MRRPDFPRCRDGPPCDAPPEDPKANGGRCLDDTDRPALTLTETLPCKEKDSTNGL